MKDFHNGIYGSLYHLRGFVRGIFSGGNQRI